ncbi:MAG: NADH-quinone oxidoreductase subunit NuoH [Ignavibacteriales bacterium]|nr:NADH-quinone oxidoreductase subunit NuoH [Ignavibacteriales bacterium]
MNLIEPLVKVVLILAVMLTLVILLVYSERRISAFIQNRIGPNRVGPKGILQAVADVVKLLMKEDIVPKNANKPIHDLAPMISIGVAMSTFAVIPIGGTMVLLGQSVRLMLADVNIGILYILALTSMGVYGITLAGWSSNSKYSLLGGLRSSAQLISYELSMGLSIVGVLLIAGTLQLDGIVQAQSAYIGGWLPAWNVFLQPVAFVTFVVSAFAETNRLPFDLPEAEPELVGGYHTEYSGLKFGLFMLSEYVNLVVASAIIVTLFLGGYSVPFAEYMNLSAQTVSLIQVLTFCVKTAGVILFFVVIRWTLPRFRYDQLMDLGWKVMLPIALANLVVTGFILAAFS